MDGSSVRLRLESGRLPQHLAVAAVPYTFQMLWLSFFGCESTLNKTTVACGLTICPLRPYEGPRILVSSLT